MGYVGPNPDDDSQEDRKKWVKLPKDGVLRLEGFIEVYRKELEECVPHALTIACATVPHSHRVPFSTRYPTRSSVLSGSIVI
jgi:hypothetical protein